MKIEDVVREFGGTSAVREALHNFEQKKNTEQRNQITELEGYDDLVQRINKLSKGKSFKVRVSNPITYHVEVCMVDWDVSISDWESMEDRYAKDADDWVNEKDFLKAEPKIKEFIKEQKKEMTQLTRDVKKFAKKHKLIEDDVWDCIWEDSEYNE
jgi:hypothetical protein